MDGRDGPPRWGYDVTRIGAQDGACVCGRRLQLLFWGESENTEVLFSIINRHSATAIAVVWDSLLANSSIQTWTFICGLAN